jgi:nucleoside diphosphate kinase
MLPKKAPIAYLEYDPAGLDIPNIGTQIAKHALRLEKAGMRLSLAKLSAGHPTELAASFHLREQERIAIRPYRELIFSAPTTAQNIKGGFEQTMSDILAVSGDKGGIIEAEIGGIAQLIRDFATEGAYPGTPSPSIARSIVSFFAAAHERAKHSQPIKLWLALNEAIHEAQPECHLDSLADLRRNTHTLYIGSEDDQIISLPGAYNDCASVYKSAGLTTPPYCDMPHKGHANIVAASESTFVRNWLHETALPAPYEPI